MLPNVLLAAPATYPSADAAATAFIDAVQKDDKAALVKVLGAEWKTVI
ncbi:MAG TPA: DUF2950 family protein, partial [Rhodanobacteraceae bacterium]|nr:DUF2950 family protein [Rhodanobacteraceae bacterium]